MNHPIVGLIAAVVIAIGVVELHLWLPAIQSVSPLLISIGVGILVSHILPARYREPLVPGLNIAKGSILRVAIVLYGFNITLQALSQVGIYGLFSAVTMVSIILFVGIWAGTKLFKLDKEQAILVAVGSAICGAAAVAAMEPIIKAKPHKVMTAISTVVVFGTLSMLLMPLVFQFLDITEAQYGLWVGVSVHEVAQVVVAGDSVSSNAAHMAVLEKMLRVVLLVPVLLTFAVWMRQKSKGSDKESGDNKVSVPWFAFLFIGAIIINSLNWIPDDVTTAFTAAATYLLCIAMTALGMLTHISVIKQGGAKAFALAALLFVSLFITGYLLAQFA